MKKETKKYPSVLEHAPHKYAVVDDAVPEWSEFIKLVKGFDRLEFGSDVYSVSHKKAKGSAYELYCNHREFTPYDLAIALGLLESIDGEAS